MYDMEIAQEKISEFEQDSATIVQRGMDMVKIQNEQENDSALSALRLVKGRLKDLEAIESTVAKPINDAIKSARGAKKALTELFSVPKLRYQRAESHLKGIRGAWETLQVQLRAKEQAKLDAKARKERERKMEQMRKAEEAGDAEKAAALAAHAASIVAPVIQAPKQQGSYFVEIWNFEITDPSKVPPEYTMVDETKIGQVVRATKGTLQIPGVRIYSTKSERVRR